MLSLLGLMLGLALLIYMTVRGVELLIAAPLCALFVAATSGIAFFPQLATEGAPAFTSAYMGGFVGFVQAWFFMFLLGSLFGKVMEASGAADAVAAWIVRRTGPRHAARRRGSAPRRPCRRSAHRRRSPPPRAGARP